MLRKKFKKILAISMAFSMIFSTNVFATPIDLANSEIDVRTDTLDKSTGTDYFTDEENEWLDGTINEEVRVRVDLASQFIITIPKEIVLDGETGKADYKVKAVGDIAGDQKLSVVPDADFILKEAGGKADVTAIVTQPDTEYVYTDLQGDGTEYDGNIAATLTAGEWSGKFAFNISFTEGSLPQPGKALETYSWDEVAAISEAGLAEEYFEIGDEKKITLNSTASINTLADEGETYTLQIIGFNHDDLADGSGKAGITFQFKECIGTYVMNSTRTNKGGWEASEMRTYLYNNILSLISDDINKYIKTVNKITDSGSPNFSASICIDKIFLLSYTEINQSHNRIPKNQGVPYEYYIKNGISYKKELNSEETIYWWTRSSTDDTRYEFAHVRPSGNTGYAEGYANATYGVAPAFCI